MPERKIKPDKIKFAAQIDIELKAKYIGDNLRNYTSRRNLIKFVEENNKCKK